MSLRTLAFLWIPWGDGVSAYLYTFFSLLNQKPFLDKTFARTCLLPSLAPGTGINFEVQLIILVEIFLKIHFGNKPVTEMTVSSPYSVKRLYC